jgi:hypothetical protein
MESAVSIFRAEATGQWGQYILQNVGNHLPDYMVSLPRTEYLMNKFVQWTFIFLSFIFALFIFGLLKFMLISSALFTKEISDYTL